MIVIKPLYGIAEAGLHWWVTYNAHHKEKLGMVTSTYDPRLLITDTKGKDNVKLQNSSIHMVQKAQGKKLKLVNTTKQYVEQQARGAYIASICQPEATFILSIAAQTTTPTEADIKSLNRRIEWQMKHVDRGIKCIHLLFLYLVSVSIEIPGYNNQVGLICCSR